MFTGRICYISGGLIDFCPCVRKLFGKAFTPPCFEIISKKRVLPSINFLDNYNSFSEDEWKGMTKFANETFVEESDELKEKSAGAGLTDND